MYCFVGDLSGFQNIVRNLPLDQQDVRIKQWIYLVESTAKKCGVEVFKLISDMVIAITPENLDGIGILIKFSQILLEEGLQLKLPLRGAIAQGEVKMSDQIAFGRALVDAYQLATNQNWLGVSISHDVSGFETVCSIEKLIIYPPPLKNGMMRLMPVVSWKIPPSNELIKLTLGAGLTRPNEIIEWDYVNKINNTVIFSLYLKVLMETEKITGKRVNTSKFFGFTPLEIIEHKIDGHRLDLVKED
jgi:hypothetical protein